MANNKPACVQLFAADDEGNVIPIEVSDDGFLKLAADVDIDTTGLATSAKQDTLLAALQHPTKVTAVTKSDSTDITATASKGIWVGTGGDIALRGVGDSSATTLAAVPSGTYIPGAYMRVMSAGTTASNIVSFS